jgi:hypothetical protein
VFDALTHFLKRQKPNFKMLILRDFIWLAIGTRPRVSPQIQGYQSLFLARLGASPLDIGFLAS